MCLPDHKKRSERGEIGNTADFSVIGPTYALTRGPESGPESLQCLHVILRERKINEFPPHGWTGGTRPIVKEILVVNRFVEGSRPVSAFSLFLICLLNG
jgi:hypothetical protein